MNKIISYILVILLFSTPCFAVPRWYNATSLTGGGTAALDSINGQNLNDGDIAIVVTSTHKYYYLLDADASATEASPQFINPDSNAGTKSWVLIEGVLEEDMSDNSSSGTGEDDLASTTISANVMGTSRGLRIHASGTITGSNDTKTIKLYFGASSATVISQAAGDTNDWEIKATIYNTAAGAQRLTWSGMEADGTTETFGYNALSVDTTANVTLKLTGECANGSDTITQTTWRVELF
jgi:hypothetical protein